MTEGQVKAMFTMLEYLAQQVVSIKQQLSRQRSNETQKLRQARALAARHLAEKIQIKQQLDELLKFQ